MMEANEMENHQKPTRPTIADFKVAYLAGDIDALEAMAEDPTVPPGAPTRSVIRALCRAAAAILESGSSVHQHTFRYKTLARHYPDLFAADGFESREGTE